MSETQDRYFQQEKAHFIRGGTRSAKVYLDDFLDAIDSTNREHAKAEAPWPLLRCRCRCGVLGVGCWCVGVLCVVLLCVVLLLCCVLCLVCLSAHDI